MNQFINKKFEVEESDKKTIFGKGEKREDYAAGWRTSDRIFLVGLPGSGRRELARMLGEELNLPVLEPADKDALHQACAAEGAVIVADAVFFDDEELVRGMNRSGKVFYMMTDAQTLTTRVAERDGIEDAETLWRNTADTLDEMEPKFMAALHFILQASNRPGDLVKDALEKISW